MNTEGRRSLGVLNAELVPRPDWLSTRIADPYLELSTCHGQVSPDQLPLYTASEQVLGTGGARTMRVELGISVQDSVSFQAEEDLKGISLQAAPTRKILGYEILGIDWGGVGWHTQHCHNAADANEGKTITFNVLGLIDSQEDAVRLADWYLQEESGAEPVFWMAVSVHQAAVKVGEPSDELTEVSTGNPEL
jgi:hypothetical protein